MSEFEHDSTQLAADESVDMVNSPPHYTNHASGIEWIDVGRHLTADWMNAGKYVFRAELKNGLQDLQKALWYIEDSLTHGIRMFGTTWRFEHQQMLKLIAEHEPYDARKLFFQNMIIGNRSAAKMCVEVMIKEWVKKP